MDPNLLLAVLTFFVFLVALAMCIQAGLLFGIWKATKSLQEQVTSLMPQVKTVLVKAETTIDESRKSIGEITAKASEITSKVNEITSKANDLMDAGKVQMAKIDEVMTDASTRAKVQLEHAELVVDDTMSRVHESVTAVHSGILKPIREIQGMTAGVRAAVEHFLRGGRPSVAQATQDDEMFI
jgi:uncharacterized protein YoxC